MAYHRGLAYYKRWREQQHQEPQIATYLSSFRDSVPEIFEETEIINFYHFVTSQLFLEFCL